MLDVIYVCAQCLSTMQYTDCLVAQSASQLQVSVNQKHLSEARSGILSILHTIMSSVTLLWSVLHQADSSDKPAAASAASTSNINLGSTKVTGNVKGYILLIKDLAK